MKAGALLLQSMTVHMRCMAALLKANTAAASRERISFGTIEGSRVALSLPLTGKLAHCPALGSRSASQSIPAGLIATMLVTEQELRRSVSGPGKRSVQSALPLVLEWTLFWSRQCFSRQLHEAKDCTALALQERTRSQQKQLEELSSRMKELMQVCPHINSVFHLIASTAGIYTA